MLKLINDAVKQQYNLQAHQLNLLPIKITPRYEKLVNEEYQVLGEYGGPLYRAVYPDSERLTMQISHEIPDFVKDQSNMPLGLRNILIHKYRHRALFLVTEKCAGHCMYCFRQALLNDIYGHPLPPLEERIERVKAYLINHPDINELILSGGDPLMIKINKLQYLFEELINNTPIRDIRIHTRNLIFAPQLFTDKLIALLSKYHVRLYLHVIHPYEIDETIIKLLKRLQQAGIRMYSQFPILRRINDHVQVLEKLLRQLDELQINLINLFIPDPINYSASFRIPMHRLLKLTNELFWKTASWHSNARLVLDTPIGKVRYEDIVDWNQQNGEIIFQRAEQKIIYHDFPAQFDTPGELTTLLWKG